MENKNLEHKRHTLAHLLAAAVREIYPGAQNAIGPNIDNGFYQDFDMGDYKVSDTDLAQIENKMREILKTWSTFTKQEVTIEEARKEFSWNPYKLELMEEFAEGGKTLTFYTSGNFLDLCKGGHVENAQEIIPDSFMLSRVAGAYWRGDEKNKMLTRIYGLAFDTKEELNAYTLQIEEAKKRDHRKLGKELGLFVFSDLVGPGLPLWTPKGTIIRELLNDYVWELRQKEGYQKVCIPHITKKNLYETSGHWAKYADDLFKIETREKHIFAMKPMNCPHHTQIFDSEPRSYRDMPQRYCETTMVYRDEQSGELSGLSRVLSITQDDAHVFCRENQIEEEALKIWDIIEKFYGAFGFKLKVRFSRRDMSTPEKYMGDSSGWDKAEKAILDLIKTKTTDYMDGEGEAAFYGPKIDFMAYDSIGRQLQVATIQIDFVQPTNFSLEYTNEEGKKTNVVMIHAAIMGSIERFMSTLIEHLAGNFPLWLSPNQVTIIPVNLEKHLEKADALFKQFKDAGIRTILDDKKDSLGKRIHGAKADRTPYVIVLGDKEIESNLLTVETRSEKIVGISTEDFIIKVLKEIKEKTLN